MTDPTVKPKECRQGIHLISYVKTQAGVIEWRCEWCGQPVEQNEDHNGG